MIEVNGVSLIRRLFGILDQENLTRIIIVDGYMGANLKEYVLSLDVTTPVVSLIILYTHNQQYLFSALAETVLYRTIRSCLNPT